MRQICRLTPGTVAGRVVCLAALLFRLAWPANLPASDTGGDWPRFLGPTANCISTETGLLDKFQTNTPALLWEKTIGSGYSAPSVAGNMLVLHHRIKDEEIVECFTADTGQPVWRYAYASRFVDPFGYSNGPRCTPLLTSNRCYTFGAEGKLLCLELANGKLIWQRDTGVDWNEFDNHLPGQEFTRV